MKMGTQRPVRDALVIQLERGSPDYEVYWIEPTMLGTLKKESSARIVTEDGQVFRSLGAAAAYLAAKPRVSTGQRRISATELIEAGKWVAFREMRGMAPAADASEYSKVFVLSDDESRRLGL